MSNTRSIPRIIAVIALAMFFAACDEGTPTSLKDALGENSGTIVTASPVEQSRGVVTRSGGSITVDRADSPIHGFRITVPADAFAASKEFIVSSAEIKSHRLGPNFNPVSPMIIVTNGGSYADEYMMMRIPIRTSPDRFPMAFYYDPSTGALEGIATRKIEDGFLTVMVRHFSWIVVSDVQRDILIAGGGFDTDFLPSSHGWSFVNDGSAAAPDGVCAGMSVGAAYFYEAFRNNLNIQKYFDNDQLWWSTPEFWQDDGLAIKFVSAIQRRFFETDRWRSTVSNGYSQYGDPQMHFFNTLYAMLVTRKPQVLLVAAPWGTPPSGHAIVAYAYTVSASGGTLSVYDPNYPNKSGTVLFDLPGDKFHPYTSGNNATAVAAGHVYHYDSIAYLPFSSAVPRGELDELWKQVNERSIGTGIFPAYELYGVPRNTPGQVKIRLLDVTGGKENIIPDTECDIILESQDPSFSFEVETYQHLSGVGITRNDPASPIYLDKPKVTVGVQVWAIRKGGTDREWAGFHWMTFVPQTLWIEPGEPSAGVNQDILFTAHSGGTAPRTARYEWTFGDGTPLVAVSSDSTVTHAFANRGQYTVKVKVINTANSQIFGETQVTATIGAPSKINVTVSGMESGDTESTIKLSDGSNVSTFGFTNSTQTTTPLVWTGRSFTVTHVFTLVNAHYTETLTGKMSADWTKVEMLTCTATGTTDDGDWEHLQTLDLRDVPLTELLPGQTYSADLRGSAAHAVVATVAYTDRRRDGQGNWTTVQLASVDWNSQKTRLTVTLNK